MRRLGVLLALLMVLAVGLSAQEYVNSGSVEIAASAGDTIVFASPYPDGITLYSEAAYQAKRSVVGMTDDAYWIVLAAGQTLTWPGNTDTIFTQGSTDTIYAFPWYR